MHKWYENDDANLCSDCYRKLVGKKPSIPKFSIAAGYDFGHPLRAGLEPLTILERKLISRNIIFATIVKLVASCGSNTPQHGLQGHVISMPHEGAHIAAAVLPRMQSVTDMISVMFVGSAEQWHASSGKSGDNKRADFIISHKSIFQVRAHVVFAWLHALKAVGNPLYSDVEILESTEETNSSLEQIPNILIDQAHVASNEKTIETEIFTVSDVAHVRPQAIEGDENGIGLNSVLLKNIPLANAAPVSAVLGSLYNTLVQKNVNADQTESILLLSDHKPDSVLSVNCHEKLINEFVENDSLFLGAFPDLFFVGMKFPSAGSVPNLFTQHLLRQADNRFAQVDELIFTLFNQSQRHAAARGVATHVCSDSDSVHQFTNIVEAPNFMEDLKSAIESPDTKESRALMNSIMPLVRVSGASVPFGPVQRSMALSKLCAMIHYFGLPSWFVTVSPSDLDSIIILRLATPLKDNNDSMQCQFVVPDFNVCIKTLANNPAAAAEVFIRLITALFECLVALPLHHTLKQSHCSVGERRQGIFGVPVAHFCAIEVQGRGSLHAHFIVMGGVAPDIMQSAVDNPEYLSVIQKKLDSMVKAEIPNTYFKQSVNATDTPKKQFRPALIQSPIPALDADAFWDHVYLTAAAVQCHKHSSTCRKGKSGRHSCRMAMPQHCWNKATGPVQLVSVKIHSGIDCNKILCSVPRALKCVELKKIDNFKFNMPFPQPDSRSIIYELCRRSSDDAELSANTPSKDSSQSHDESMYECDDDPSGPNSNVVAYSPALTSALGCNTATYPLGNTSQAKATCYYLVKYITKDAAALTNTLSCLMEAKQCIEKYPSQAADSGTQVRNAMHLITRTLNNLSSKMEISAAMAAASLLGLPATVSSHDFWYVFVWPAVKAAKIAQQKIFGIVEYDLDSHISDEDEEISDDTNEHTITDILLQGQDHLIADAQLAVDEPATGEIHLNKSGHVTVVPQYVHYMFRGVHLVDFSLYDYAGCVLIVKKNTHSDDKNEADEDYENHDLHGRHKNKTFAFDPRHPLFETHEQHLRSKQFVPILAGVPPPCYPGLYQKSSIWNAAALRFAEYVLCAFVPWDLDKLAPPMLLNWNNFCIWAAQRTVNGEEVENSLAHDFVENCRLAIVKNIAHNMTVSCEEKKLIAQWRSRSATEWRGQPGEPKSTANPTDEVNADDITTDQEMEHFIEQLRRQHGADAAHINTRAHIQEKHELDTIELLSNIFTSSHEVPASESCILPVVPIDPILYRTIDEINGVLQQIAEPESVEESSVTPLISIYDGHATISAQSDVGQQIVQPNSRLNIEQNNALVSVLSWLSEIDNYTNDAPEQLLMFIHGGPGVGKSFFARELIKCIDSSRISCAAPTGIAASELFKGRTLHDLLGLPTTIARVKILPPLRPDKAAQLSLRIQKLNILLIDELSMVDDLLFSWVDQRLQQLRHNTLPFGGLGIILMGDFLQLPPVIGCSLFKAAIHASSPGGLLFRKFKLHEFHQQMRAADDAIHTENINSFRIIRNPVTSNLLSSLHPLTVEDVLDDPSWREAPIVVTGNSERMAISRVQAIRFGQMHNLPVFTWRQPLSANCTLKPDDQKLLYDNVSELTGWFVQGAPAHMTSNINPSKGLANGTAIVLHSLTLAHEANVAAINSQIAIALPGSIICLEYPPTSVNVIVSSLDNWPNSQSLVQSNAVIPLKNSRRPQSLTRSDGKRVTYHDYGYSLAFSVTFHKMQGKTVSKLILDLNHNSQVPLTLQSLYVGISRVRHAKDLRVIPALSPSGWSHLQRLHQNDAYLQWCNSYQDHIFRSCQLSDNVDKKHCVVTSLGKHVHDEAIHYFENSLTDYNKTLTDLLEINQLNITLAVDVHQYLFKHHLTIIPAQSDGHCLMHAWSIATGQSMLEVENIVSSEFFSRKASYLTFGITEEDLASYLSDRQHALQSVDAVLNMLCNACNMTAVVIGQKFRFFMDPSDNTTRSEPFDNITEFKQIKPASGQSMKTVFLLKTASHYDAIVNN